MNADLKLYTGLGVKSGALWLLIVIGGIGVAMMFLVLALHEAWQTAGGSAGTLAGMPFIKSYAMEKPFAAISIIGAPFFALITVAIANKVAMQSILCGLWSNKAVHHVEPAVRDAVARFYERAGGDAATSNLALLRQGVMDAAGNDSMTSKITRRVIQHVLKKIDLKGIDLQSADTGVGDAVARRVSEYVAASTEPSLRPFWILLAVQTGVFLVGKFY